MLIELLLIEEWTWNFPLLAGLSFVLAAYLYFYRRLLNRTVFSKQPLLFTLAILLLYMAGGSPFAQFSHLSFSLHMLQMSILYFIVPPLFLLGLPYPLCKHVAKLPVVEKIKKFLLPPMAALCMFAILFTLYHLPFMLEFLLQHVFLQKSYSILLFALSFSMWYPLTAHDAGNGRSKFALYTSLLLMPACLLLIVYPLAGGSGNPFLSGITAALCIPLEAGTIDLLPPFFHSNTDRFIAGLSMLFIHKCSIITVMRLRGRIGEKEGTAAMMRVRRLGKA